jgi:non-canonical poly(A) RNA polymerase PAPD5/7
LHILLGRKPQPTGGKRKETGGNGNPSSSSSSGAAKSVQLAWQEADYDDNQYDRRRGRHATGDEEEEGRYDISRQQPPSKRRKTGRPQDFHTIFTTDDEDELIVGDTADEDAHYASDGVLENSASRDPEKADKRRSYWLSKGIGLGSGAGDDST